MSSSTVGIIDTSLLKTAYFTLNLSQTAATYTAGTVSVGDIFITEVQPYCSISGTGFTTVAIGTDDTTNTAILTATSAASVTGGKNLGLFSTSFVLPSGKHITFTLVGNGTGGTIKLAVQYMSLTSGAIIS